MRAWTGILNADALARISGKSVSLISDVLDDREKRREYLSSDDDAMKVHLALWAEGFYDAQAAADSVMFLASYGSRVQKLAAGYYSSFLTDILGICREKRNTALACKVIEANPGDNEMFAVYNYILPGKLNRRIREISASALDMGHRRENNLDSSGNEIFHVPVKHDDHQKVRPELNEYFESRGQSAAVFAEILRVYESMKKKEILI